MIEKEQMKKGICIPNCITGFRILGTLFLLAVEPFSLIFYIIYTLCGLSDVLDGWVARATNTTSEFGAKLDSIADLVYYAVMFVRLLPYLWRHLPVKIWYIVALIVLIRFLSYGIAAFKYHRFASIHTYANKATGAVIFSMPYFIVWERGMLFISITACIVAGAASLEELLIHICSKEYRSEKKTLFKDLNRKRG